jgi:hypothetical protein
LKASFLRSQLSSSFADWIALNEDVTWLTNIVLSLPVYAENHLLLYLKVRSDPFRIDVLRSIPNGVPMWSGLLVCSEPA